MLIRKRLTPDEVSPARIRVNPDTGDVEETWDGGTSWTPAPLYDPRHSDAQRAPPLASAFPQCDAAASIIAATQAAAQAAIDGLNVGMVATNLLGVLLAFMPLAGILETAILEIAGALFAVGASVIDSALTSEVYDQLLCILLNHLDDDGQLDSTGYAALLSEVDSTFDFDTAAIIHLLWDGEAEVGLSNAGALGSVTGDCAACDSWTAVFDFTLSEQGWSQDYKTTITWDSEGWHGHYDTEGSPAGTNAVSIGVAFAETLISTIDVAYITDTAGGGLAGMLLSSVADTAAGDLYSDAITNADGAASAHVDLNATLTFIGVWIYNGISGDPSVGNPPIITQITLTGTGDCPFGSYCT